MVIISAILMATLLSYLPGDLQRSPTYYYNYITLLSFRVLLLIGLQYLHAAPHHYVLMYVINNFSVICLVRILNEFTYY